MQAFDFGIKSELFFNFSNIEVFKTVAEAFYVDILGSDGSFETTDITFYELDKLIEAKEDYLKDNNEKVVVDIFNILIDKFDNYSSFRFFCDI